MAALSYTARALRYARAVTTGKKPAGKYVRAACERHLDDLDRAKKAKRYPFRYDSAAADKVCRFAENMIHIKGRWAERKKGEAMPYIHLEDWQCFILCVCFGWLRIEDGMRRFRELYSEIPRKNSKSTLGAVIGLYMAFADRETGAEVYAGATSRDQSYEVFRPAWLMVRNNVEFKKRFGLELAGTEKNPGNIFQLSSGSRFEPVIGRPGDGSSPHGAIIDEYHEHTVPDLYDAMKTGMGARSQPMRIIITTAGTDTSGPCYDKHLEAIKVLEGTLKNEELFAIIFGIDVSVSEGEPGDDWADFAVWQKANPNYGVSVYPDYLKGQLRDAMQQASQQNIILTKNLNVWQNAGAAWMNMLIWDKQRADFALEDFKGKQAWLGLDLASKIDIASIAVIVKVEGGLRWIARHYLPIETVELPENAHYRKWAEEGWLTVTDTPRTDMQRIEDDVREISKIVAVQELAFDPRESNMLITSIQTWASFQCVEIPQGPAHMNEPMKEMEAQIYAGTLKHNGDPLLTWQMGNVVKKQARGGGPTKYYYPTKQSDKNKIDAVVAGIMAVGRAEMPKPKPTYQMMFFGR